MFSSMHDGFLNILLLAARYFGHVTDHIITMNSPTVPQTPTCQAMQSVAHNISQFGLVCWSSDPCEIVNCINQFGTPQLQLNILKCNDPQAVEVVMMYSQNVVWFRHIFTQSEVVPVYYSTSVMMLNVTLDHKKTGIGLSVSTSPLA